MCLDNRYPSSHHNHSSQNIWVKHLGVNVFIRAWTAIIATVNIWIDSGMLQSWTIIRVRGLIGLRWGSWTIRTFSSSNIPGWYLQATESLEWLQLSSDVEPTIAEHHSKTFRIRKEWLNYASAKLLRQSQRLHLHWKRATPRHPKQKLRPLRRRRVLLRTARLLPPKLASLIPLLWTALVER